MKNIKKIFLLLVVFGSLLSFSSIEASTDSYTQNMSVSRHGSSASQVINTPPFGVDKQVYSVDISGTYDGHGAFGPSGGKYGISVCISNTGAMWNGSCWNVIDPNGAGNIGDGYGNIPGATVTIGNTSNDFNFVSANVYVNDADANVSLRMNGREVSINGFNTTSGTVAVGSQFDITWNATERTANTVLTYSGPVSCDWNSGDSSNANTDGTTCTGTSAGTATFNLRATGYGGYGTKNVNSQPINVSIVSPPVSCGNNTVEAGEQCDTGVNNGACPRSCSNACTTNSCSANLCGNGVVNAGEQCDSGVNNGAPPRACSSYCTNNVVSGTVNISLTVNGPGTVGTNLVAGRFGPGAYSGTIPTNTFVQFDVIPTPGEASSWTWGGPCSFFNSPLSSVCAGNATVDTANVVTFIPIPVTGTLTPANSSCTIPAGQSGCYSPTLSWSTAGFRNGIVAAVTSSTGVPASVSGNSGSSAFYVPHNSGDPANEFYLSHNGVTLATAVVNTSCVAGTVWSGGVCAVVSTPTLDSVILNSSSIAPDGSTQYTVTVRGTDSGGGDKISHEYALINLEGANSASPRGYLTWYFDQAYVGWNALKDKMSCTGGGIAAIQDGYGNEYIELDSCVTSVSGLTRTTTFTVRFNSVFGANGPLTLNDISGYVHNKDGNLDGWRNFDINFGLFMPPPTGLTVTCPAPGTSLIASWTAPSAFYNNFYYRASTPSTDWTGNVDQSSVVGTTKTIPSVTGQTYNVWVHTRHPSNVNFYSSLVSSTVTCTAAGAVPTVTSPTVSAITTTGATLGANVTNLGNPASISARGTCWGATNPPVTNCSPASGLTTGVYTHVRGSMTAGTPYFYRGYADNATGRGYSPVGSFTTTAAASPTLSASPLNPTAGSGNLTATFANIPSPMSLDWIALYPVGAADAAYIDWVWASDCTRTQPTTSAPGRANGSCNNLPVPATPGNYEFRMFANNGWTGWPTKLTSQTIVVAGVAPYTLNVTANPGPGGRITGTGIDCGADCSEAVAANSTVLLTAVPASSYWRFNGWGGACSGTSTTCNVTVSSNPTSVTASFVPRAFIYREF